MKFQDIINYQLSLLSEADETQPTDNQPTDAAAPAPGATPAQPQEVANAPDGYADIVKLLAMATAMNFPAGALDTLYQTPIKVENAFKVRDALKAAKKENTVDNQERLNNPHFKKFYDSINETNYQDVLKYLESVVDPKNTRSTKSYV